MKNWIWTTWLAFILSILGFFLLIFFSCINAFNDWNWVIDTTIADHLGSLIGGVVGSLFSLAGIFLLYETIIKQQDLFKIQQFESKYFELIRYHRENVDSLKYVVPDSTAEQTINGREFFVQLNHEFDMLYSLIQQYTKDLLSEQQRINMTTVILFYGVSKRTRLVLEDSLSDYEPELVSMIIRKLERKKTKYNNEMVFFGGHQNRLDHYIRHFAQTIKYIDRSDFLNSKKKYEYAKLVRAQMTQFELMHLFYNTLSRYGVSWKKYQLITKYQLIKNLPRELSTGIKPNEYYPDVKFDWKEK